MKKINILFFAALAAFSAFGQTYSDKAVTIDTNQTGNAPGQQDAFISVSPSSLSFPPSGNKSAEVRIHTSESTFRVSSAPAWCQVQAFKGYILVYSYENNTNASRYDVIKVSAGGKEASIHVSQASNICFNCPKGKPRIYGISLGYVKKQWQWNRNGEKTKYGVWDADDTSLGGLQIGARITPLFKYGFGIQTGLFYEYYYSKSDIQTSANNDESGAYDYNMIFMEHSLHLPLYMEYRANIYKRFQLFIEAGPSLDCGLNAKIDATEAGKRAPYETEKKIYRNADAGFPKQRFNLSFDFGAGFRLGGVQLNVGMSRGLMNISTLPDIRIKQNKPLMASLLWIFE